MTSWKRYEFIVNSSLLRNRKKNLSCRVIWNYYYTIPDFIRFTDQLYLDLSSSLFERCTNFKPT